MIDCNSDDDWSLIVTVIQDWWLMIDCNSDPVLPPSMMMSWITVLSTLDVVMFHRLPQKSARLELSLTCRSKLKGLVLVRTSSHGLWSRSPPGLLINAEKERVSKPTIQCRPHFCRTRVSQNWHEHRGVIVLMMMCNENGLRRYDELKLRAEAIRPTALVLESHACG